MRLRPEEITSILKQRIEEYDVETNLAEVGTVLQVGDGIARVYGLENCFALEMLEFEHGVTGLALNLESDNVGAALFGDWARIQEGSVVRRSGRIASVPVGDALVGRIVDPLGNPLDGGRSDRRRPVPSARVQGARRRRSPAREGAAADRPQGDRLDDPDRSRPARARDRRPRDGQDGHPHRHDPQPEGRRRHLRLRRHRPEGLERGPGGAAPERRGRHGLHDRRLGLGRGGGADQVDGPVRRLRDGGVLLLRRAATRSACTTTSPSTPTPTARCLCCCAAHRAGRRSRATCSTCTRGCSSAPASSPTSWAAAP